MMSSYPQMRFCGCGYRTRLPGGVPVNEFRRQRMNVLAEAITSCTRCPGMNKKDETQAAPGYGSVRSPVVIVGQSLCRQCMEPQEPFYKGSGVLLDRSFKKAGVKKKRLFTTNVVHCHPPKNKTSLPLWVKNCRSYLQTELEIVQPRLVIGLGEDAEEALTTHYRKSRMLVTPALMFAKHPSWILRQHDPALEKKYVSQLAHAIRWALDG